LESNLILDKVTKHGKSELAFASSLFLLGIFVAWDTSRMEIPQGSSIVSPQTFPYIVAAFTSFVGLGLLFDVLRGNHGTPDGDEPGDPLIPVNYKTLLIVAVAISLHVILLQTAGYIVAATVCFLGVAYGFGSRKILKDLFVSLVFAVVVYFSFTKGLNINLPSGVFEGMLGNG
jgi:putative tricarboxylic transport membrane protein